MMEQVKKLCKKVNFQPPVHFTYIDDYNTSRILSLSVCTQVHVQVVDIFDNADVVMSKFIQSLLERVLQVYTLYIIHSTN